MVEHLPSNWCVVSLSLPEQHFSKESRLLRSVACPFFESLKSHVITRFGVGNHYWFNYRGLLLNVKLKFILFIRT